MFGRKKQPAPSAPRKADGAKLMMQVCIFELTAAFQPRKHGVKRGVIKCESAKVNTYKMRTI